MSIKVYINNSLIQVTKDTTVLEALLRQNKVKLQTTSPKKSETNLKNPLITKINQDIMILVDVLFDKIAKKNGQITIDELEKDKLMMNLLQKIKNSKKKYAKIDFGNRLETELKENITILAKLLFKKIKQKRNTKFGVYVNNTIMKINYDKTLLKVLFEQMLLENEKKDKVLKAYNLES